MANLFEPDFDAGQDRPGFSWRRAKLAAQAGAERLGASLYEIPPGEASFPYHAHSANEELLIVIEGRPSLRTEQGWRQLAPGEVVSFAVGPGGAHQLQNRTEQPVRVLLVSEMNAPEVSLYPDSGKILAGTRPPGGAGTDQDIFEFYPRSAAVDYLDGEEPPASK